MHYVVPREQELSQTYNDVKYAVAYYKPATKITGVTDQAYTVWDGVTPTNTGGYVIVSSLKKIYRSTIDTNTSYPPANPNDWVDYGVVNSYAMFATDEDIGSKTTGTDMTLEFDFSQSDSIAGLELSFTSADMMVINEETYPYLGDYNVATTYALNDLVWSANKIYRSLSAGNLGNALTNDTYWVEDPENVVYYESISGRNIDCLSFADYFYRDIEDRTRVIKTDLPWLSNSTLRIDLGGAASIGTIAYGAIDDLGVTLYGTQLSFESTSKFSTSEFTGFKKITRYGKIRILDVSVSFDNVDFNILSAKVGEILDKNIVWVPTPEDKFSEMISLGYIENFDIPIGNPKVIFTKAKIIGVST